MTLSLEDARSGLSGKKGTIQVHLHDLSPLLIRVVFSCDGRYNARVANNDVQFTKVLCDLLDGSLDFRLTGDVGLICCCFDIVRRCNFLSNRVGVFG
jgi:hypothetical protein